MAEEPRITFPKGELEGREHPKENFFLRASFVSKEETLSDHQRSSQLMVAFQAAVTGCWDRCLAGM